MSYNYQKNKKWWWEEKLVRDGDPEPFEIPKGYKSPFVEGEMDLNELWAGKAKMLRKYATHTKKAAPTEAADTEGTLES